MRWLYDFGDMYFLSSIFSWFYIEDFNKYYGFTKKGCIVIDLSPALTTSYLSDFIILIK